MFGCVKMTQRKLTALSAMCFIIFLGVCVLMLRAAAPDTVELNGDAYSLIAEDEDDAARFLEAAGYEVGELVSDSEITVADLKGKRIAVPQRGKVPDWTLRLALKNNGLEIEEV